MTGGYGFLARFDISPSEMEAAVDAMFDTLGIEDVQFQDWFDNYSGRYQTFVNAAPAKPSRPN